MLVLSLDTSGSAAAASGANGSSSSSGSGSGGNATPYTVPLPATWRTALARQRDPRLYVLPFALHARVIWREIAAGDVAGGGAATQDVFACAQAWREAEERGIAPIMARLATEVAMRNAALDSWKEDEWDLDLMTAPGYVHGRNTDEGETDTREFPVFAAYSIDRLADADIFPFCLQRRCSGDSFHLPTLCEKLACDV
jgi:hypothetical protein